jgi:hypothetical protein
MRLCRSLLSAGIAPKQKNKNRFVAIHRILHVENAGHTTPYSSGLQLGSRYLVNPEKELVFDYPPESLMQKKVRSLQDFARVLVLDKWTGNADGRQVIFSRSAKARKYSATFIDQGYCFNAGEWNFPDSPLRGVFARNGVYECVTGWESFESVLSRAEQMNYNELCSVTSGLPGRLVAALWLFGCPITPVRCTLSTAFGYPRSHYSFPQFQSQSLSKLED